MEVRPKGVNKGVVAMHIVKNLQVSGKGKLEFALAMGDDHCDEPMLSVMRQVGRRAAEARLAKSGQALPPLPATIAQVDVSSCDGYISTHFECFTCTVGKKPSAAANYVNDVDDVHELLESLVKVSTREIVHSGFHSVVDLKSIGGKSFAPPLKPVLSMGELRTSQHSSNDEPAFSIAQTRVSVNLNEFLGTIDQSDEDDEDIFF